MFEGIPLPAFVALAKRGQKCVFPAGTHLMRQREPSNSLHIILRGRVSLEREHPSLTEPVVLAELGPGEVVAKVGLLDEDPSSETATALEDTETLEFSANVLVEMVLKYPRTAGTLVRTLSRRLTSAEELAEYLARQGRTSVPTVPGSAG